MILKYIAGPLVGALIGYCTNYIAVKMLFRPREEIRIFGHRLPFTPGAIPKGRPRLAKAVGEVVSKTLVTQEDLLGQLLNEDVKGVIIGKLMSYLALELPAAIGNMTGDMETVPKLEQEITSRITTSILQAAADVNMGELAATKGTPLIFEKLQGSFLAMFVSERQIEPMARSVGEEAQLYIADHGRELLEPHILEKLQNLEDQSILDILEEQDIDRCQVREALGVLYEDAVTEGIGKALKEMNLSGMIEDKINAMSMEEVEVLVLTVMKNELNAIVNLGAFIGLVLGLIMLFF